MQTPELEKKNHKSNGWKITSGNYPIPSNTKQNCDNSLAKCVLLSKWVIIYRYVVYHSSRLSPLEKAIPWIELKTIIKRKKFLMSLLHFDSMFWDVLVTTVLLIGLFLGRLWPTLCRFTPMWPLLSGQMPSAESTNIQALCGCSPPKHPHLPIPHFTQMPSPHWCIQTLLTFRAQPNDQVLQEVLPQTSCGLWALFFATQQIIVCP